MHIDLHFNISETGMHLITGSVSQSHWQHFFFLTGPYNIRYLIVNGILELMKYFTVGETEAQIVKPHSQQVTESGFKMMPSY